MRKKWEKNKNFKFDKNKNYHLKLVSPFQIIFLKKIQKKIGVKKIPLKKESKRNRNYNSKII